MMAALHYRNIGLWWWCLQTSLYVYVQRLSQSTTVEAEVSRLTKENSLQALGTQPVTKEDLKKKAAATKVLFWVGMYTSERQRSWDERWMH